MILNHFQASAHATACVATPAMAINAMDTTGMIFGKAELCANPLVYELDATMAGESRTRLSESTASPDLFALKPSMLSAYSDIPMFTSKGPRSYCAGLHLPGRWPRCEEDLDSPFSNAFGGSRAYKPKQSELMSKGKDKNIENAPSAPWYSPCSQPPLDLKAICWTQNTSKEVPAVQS
jgi:hypothetical protein